MFCNDLSIIQVQQSISGLPPKVKKLCEAMTARSAIGNRKDPLPYQTEYICNGAFNLGCYTAREAIVVDDKSVLYRLEGSDNYAVIATNLSLGFPLTGLIDIDSQCCFNLGDPVWGVNRQLLEKFRPHMHNLYEPRAAANNVVTVLTGDSNFAHFIWNQLSALRSIGAQSKDFVVVATHEPIGKISTLTGLSTDRISTVRDIELEKLNQTHTRFVAVGNTLVTSEIRAELETLCEEFAERNDPTALAFCKARRPYAVSLRSRNRTATNFVPAVVGIVREVLRALPDASFFFDGHSLPADFLENASYSRDEYRRLVEGDLALGRSIVDALSDVPRIEEKILVTAGLDIRSSVACGRYVPAYFSHHGTVQHKLGWFHRVPGLVHSNPRTLALNPAPWVASQVEDGVPPVYIPEDFIEDVSETRESPPSELERALLHENYNFRKLDELAVFAAAYFERMREPLPEPRGSTEREMQKGKPKSSLATPLGRKLNGAAVSIRRATRPLRRSIQRLAGRDLLNTGPAPHGVESGENMPNLTHTARRLNTLASGLKATTYLEVGVERGETFFRVNVERKTGVDPNFRFDPKEFAEKSIDFFPVISDEFFSMEGDKRVYDLVFLDGLHTYEQTLRDLMSVLTMTHTNSVILIDDVLPSDVFSSLRDHGEAIKFREMNGGSGPAWHGDVFKVIAFIHDFMPTLSFKTIVEAGNAQTVVWKRIRAPVTPRFNSTETISRLTFFDLMNNFDLLSVGPEELVLETVIAELKTLKKATRRLPQPS